MAIFLPPAISAPVAAFAEAGAERKQWTKSRTWRSWLMVGWLV